MDPHDPAAAHRIVAEYTLALTRSDGADFPASVHALPYPKPIIETAILTCAVLLRDRGELTDEMRAFLEQASVALADYVDPEIARVMAEYRGALDAAAGVAARDRVHTPAWHRVSETSHLVGEIATSIATDADRLKTQFRRHLMEGVHS